MLNGFSIPVAYCEKCARKVPVVQFDLAELEVLGEAVELDKDLIIIACAICDSFLNNSKQIEIEYFAPEDLEAATGYTVELQDE